MINQNNHIQRVAHRGGSALAPENTLAAFRNALTLPIDAIELDVHMSRDGHAIVFHDYTIEKKTNGSGNILDLDFAYLRSLNAAAHFPGGWPEPQQIPTLREALTLHRDKPLCASCHTRMDPLGLALENFNALGMWRETERKQPIETAGKRGIRLRQAAALAEAARQNLAETAWQVRRRVRALRYQQTSGCRSASRR